MRSRQRTRRGIRGRRARPPAGAQFTVRNVPPHVAAGLRKRARHEGKSLNTVLVDALARDIQGPPRRYTDLEGLAGTWEDDPAFDEAIAEQDRVDDSLWR